MENHASVTGWQKLFISYKCFQLSAAVAIATFEIYGWKFSGYLILICYFSLCWQNFSKVNRFSDKKVGHVIKSCKEPIKSTASTPVKSRNVLLTRGKSQPSMKKIKIWRKSKSVRVNSRAAKSPSIEVSTSATKGKSRKSLSFSLLQKLKQPKSVI